ncbi:Unknown protein sequence [Pseudomonas syringae pv. cilantro]|uniref:Uncharacterized protein n=1 Tax=Pseudomonas syringae pv. cilantro TaxID=81035 RepID=A0A0N0GEN8_PSESX|nr:Unknown protein sequence [Pseudomonas syringae pv. cilantro]
MIVLNKFDRSANDLFECLLIKAFKEKTAIIAEGFRFEYDDVWNGEACCIHM